MMRPETMTPTETKRRLLFAKELSGRERRRHLADTVQAQRGSGFDARQMFRIRQSEPRR